MARVLVVSGTPMAMLVVESGLRQQGGRWTVEREGDVRRALRRVGREAPDVVVVGPDLRPSEVLPAVRRAAPAAMRVALVGVTDTEESLRAAASAHQVLAWPAMPDVYGEAIARGVRLRALLRAPELRALIGRIGELPPHPRLYLQLSEMLADMTCSAAEVAEVIEQDMAMAAKTLQLVNSGYFSFGRKVTNIRWAVTVLGGYAIRALVLGAEMERMFAHSRVPASVMERLHARSMQVAAACARIAEPPDEAFVAGVLHDVGELVLWAHVPERMDEARKRAAVRRRPAHEVEREVLGADHGAVGAYLLATWGLPDFLVETAAHHHEPRAASASRMEMVHAVHVASALVAEAAGDEPEPLDVELLRELGVADRIEEWRRAARLAVEEGGVPAAGRRSA